jgi:hypothetical protein
MGGSSGRTAYSVERKRNMKVKSLLLRAAMLGAVLLGIAALNQPLRAFK